MTLVSLLQGQESTKIVDRKRRKVVPFAGTDGEGEFSQMGVGLIYPDEHKGQIWGLAIPHNIVTSYRGMRIAEHMPEFGHGTLAACWYAGSGRVHSSDQKYVDEVEQAIGADVRQAILSAPLPNLDDAIRKMEKTGIEFDADNVLAEIKAGRLESTEIVDRAIANYSDKVLIFRGLSGDFKSAYDELTAGGIKATVRRVFVNYSGVADAYVTEASQLVGRELPTIRQGYGQIKEAFAGVHEDFDKLDDREGWDWPSLRETFRSETKRVNESIQKADDALLKLQEAHEVDDYKASQRFVVYHQGFDGLGRALSDMGLAFSSLARFDSCKEEGLPRNEEAYQKMEKEAKGLLITLNRTLREQMSSVYSLL